MSEKKKRDAKISKTCPECGRRCLFGDRHCECGWRHIGDIEMKYMTMVGATPEQCEEFDRLHAIQQAAEEAFCDAYAAWGVFWDKMGYHKFRTPIPEGEMERILAPGIALSAAMMNAKDRAAEMGVLRHRIAVEGSEAVSWEETQTEEWYKQHVLDKTEKEILEEQIRLL